MIRLKKNSQTVTVDVTKTVSDLENHLHAEGFTCGYRPVGGLLQTLESCILERKANLFFLKYGTLDHLCVGGEIEDADLRSPLTIKTAPRASTGPDIKKIIIGLKSKRVTFKTITLRIFPQSTYHQWGMVLSDSKEAVITSLGQFLGQFIQPRFCALIDDDKIETITQMLYIPSMKQRWAMVFELNGLRKIIEAEKEILQGHITSKLNEIFWLSRKEDHDYLTANFINDQHFLGSEKLFSPYFESGSKKSESKQNSDLIAALG